jgi:outer membrane protein W
MKSGEIFLHSDYLSIEGETSYTKEKTTFKMTPAELGFRLLLGKKSFVPYIGLGGGFYSYEDVHPGLTSLSESKMGFFGEGGLKFFVSQSLLLDLKVKYIMLKSEKDVDLGGLTYIGGIGFRF